jgi:hypothetical protein
MKTKWGNAYLANTGYYQITGGKYRGKLLHILIWEDIFGAVPEGYVIHHINGNKIDNTIFNLKCLLDTEHRKLHNGGGNHPMYGKCGSEASFYGKSHTQETRDQISKARKGKYVGEKSGNAKLTEQRVRMIKVMLRSDIKTLQQIANLFGVSKSTISYIKLNKSWRNV